MVKSFIATLLFYGLQLEEGYIPKTKLLLLDFFRRWDVFFVGRVRRILTIFLFVVHSQKIFGAIFEIDAIFLGLVGTGRGLFGG
jgi:hypothetical protein